MRQRIVHAAAELVAEKGAAGMSLDDVWARTGASRSQLYHYFEDRDDLIRAAIGDTTDAVLYAQGDLLDHLGFIRMKTRGKLRDDANPGELATATMACLEGGLLLTQVRRDPRQLRIALNAARANLRLAAV